MNNTFCARLLSSPRWLGAALVGLLLVVSVGCSQDRARAVAEMNKGIKAFDNRQNIQAVKHLEQARSLDPTYAEPALYLGDLYHHELDELDNAEQAYRTAQKRDPKNPEIAYKLGTVLADNGDYQQAIEQFNQAIELGDGQAKAWFRKARSQQAIGEYSAAVESYMKSIRTDARMKMDDEDPGGAAYHGLGELYTDFGFYDKALAVYDNGILNNEDVARLYAGRGVAQTKLKRYQQAAKSLEKALEINPRHVAATLNLAVVRSKLGQRDQAVALLEQYKRRAEDPDRRRQANGVLQKLKTAKKDKAKSEAAR